MSSGLVTIGLLIFVTGECAERRTPEPARTRFRLLPTALAAGIALWSVVGLHDYFAWSSIRWALVERIRARGTPSLREVDAGYEVNGWLTFEDGKVNANDPQCDLGPPPWFCQSRPLAIELAEPTDSHRARTLERLPVPTWLGNFPDLVLIQR